MANQHRFQASLPTDVFTGLLGLPDDTELLDVAVIHQTGQVYIAATSPTVQPEEVEPGQTAPTAVWRAETTSVAGRVIGHSERWTLR